MNEVKADVIASDIWEVYGENWAKKIKDGINKAAKKSNKHSYVKFTCEAKKLPNKGYLMLIKKEMGDDSSPGYILNKFPKETCTYEIEIKYGKFLNPTINMTYPDVITGEKTVMECVGLKRISETLGMLCDIDIKGSHSQKEKLNKLVTQNQVKALTSQVEYLTQAYDRIKATLPNPEPVEFSFNNEKETVDIDKELFTETKEHHANTLTEKAPTYETMMESTKNSLKEQLISDTVKKQAEMDFDKTVKEMESKPILNVSEFSHKNDPLYEI